MARDTQNETGETITAGGAFFGKLKALGIEYVFANSGTDFPPIIEGLIEARQNGIDLPTPITCPHESVAMGMAHGFYQISGKPQAVMLHTNVGLSNGATGAINAWCDQIPMILMSGRTPVTESGRFGARTVPIGWGQEMFDQTALIRECTKWDYELRFPEQVSTLFDRAWAISGSTPKGPVYLSLPREVLCEQTPTEGLNAPSTMQPVIAAPDPASIEEAAALLAKAKAPLIIAQRGTGSEQAFAALSKFVDDWALPLSHYWANQLSLPLSHPMHVGWHPEAFLSEADVVLVLDSLAPWWPDKVTLRPDARVIQLGPDPLFSRTPVRNFPAHVTLAGETGPTLMTLIDVVNRHPRDESAISTRRARVGTAALANRDAVVQTALRGSTGPMTKEWVSHCLGRAIKGRTATVYHELGCPLPQLDLDQHKSYFQEPHSGGLGWAFPAALGAQLADPDRLVFATMGDGSYMFANPTACHQVAEAHDLPVIVLVLNNEEWGAVRHSVEGLYVGGKASRTNEVPLTSLRPSPDFTRTAEASRAYTETVASGEELPAALERAIRVATEERRQVLLNIAISRDPLPPVIGKTETPALTASSAPALQNKKDPEEKMKISMLINGEKVDAEGGRTFKRRDPVTGDVATVAPAASVSDALKAVRAAQEAFPGWSQTSPAERRAMLMKAADTLEGMTDDIIKTAIPETGATGPWIGFNCMLAAGMLREAAAMTTQISGELIPANKPGTLAMAQRKPLGVCLGIAPWNAPVILGTRAVAMAIACGNTVVLKASELSPATQLAIGEAFAKAGVPNGVLNVITNAPEDAPEIVSALIAAPEVRHVNFTGSTEVGRIIAVKAAEHLKPVLLELGGKAPMIVLDDADIEAAVNGAAFGAFMNQGQICMSTERIIVQESIADEFVAALAAKAKALPAGNPRDHVVLGALVTPEAAQKMDTIISDATAKGGLVVAGGSRSGSVVDATLIDNVSPEMTIYSEESFGPVKPIIRVADDDEAVRVANDTAYGLSAAVFSSNIQRALSVADRIESGICHINGPTVADEAQMPFGGVKDSGYGRFGGKAAVDAFTTTRWVTIEDPHQHYPF